MIKSSIQTTIKHSQKRASWNVVGVMAGGKYKIAKILSLDKNNTFAANNTKKITENLFWNGV